MIFEAESDGSPPSDTLTDDGEARSDFLDDRWALFLSSSVPKGESFPYPLRFFDVGQDNKYSLGRVAGKPY